VKLTGLIVAISICYVGASGQQTSQLTHSPGAKELALPVEKVNLGVEGKRIVGVPNTNSMSYPVPGASDGTVLVEMILHSPGCRAPIQLLRATVPKH